MTARLIRALRKVLGSNNKTLLAWSFDERLWKIAYKIAKSAIDEAGIKEINGRDGPDTPAVTWPHISAALVDSDISAQDLHKMEMASEVYAPVLEIVDVEVLPGQKGGFLALELKSNYNYDKFFDFAVEIFGRGNVNDWRSLHSPRHKPHVSILQVAKNDIPALEELIPSIKDDLKSAKIIGRKAKADKLLTFKKFEVSNIHII